MGKFVLYDAGLCRETRGHLFRARWSVALTEFSCCRRQLLHLGHHVWCWAVPRWPARVGSGGEHSISKGWRGCLRGLRVRSGEKWRIWRCWALLSSVHVLEQQCDPSHPSPDPSPLSSALCPGPWDVSLKTVPESLGALCSRGAGVPVVRERTTVVGWHRSQELLWPMPAEIGLDSDHLQLWIMVTKTEKCVSGGFSFMSQ